MSKLWISSIGLNEYGFVAPSADQEAGAPSHLPSGTGVSITVKTQVGASERKAHLQYDGKRFSTPHLAENFNSLPQAAQAEARELSKPGGPFEVLARELLALHAELTKRPGISKFSYQWTAPNSSFRNPQYERSCGWMRWTPDAGKSELQLNVIKRDGSFGGHFLSGAFSHPAGSGSRVGLSGPGKVEAFLADLECPGAPADWKQRLADDIKAVVAAVARCEQLRGSTRL